MRILRFWLLEEIVLLSKVVNKLNPRFYRVEVKDILGITS